MTHQPGYLLETLVILAAAVAIVPPFRRMGVSAVLGYLFAGIVVGPFGLGLIRDVGRIQVLADFGVVFLLFSIGLELSFRRLWSLRRQVFGLGLLQVTICAGSIWPIARLAGVSGDAALVLAGALALSSTAIVLQVLVDRHELSTVHGRTALSVLLLQDLAVVPLLTLLPLLAATGESLTGTLAAALARSVLVLAAVLGAGRLLLRPLLAAVARGKNPELFTGIALLLVLGFGAATQLAGLSMALGAFLAGLLIAETEYRPQVMSDVAPFRGILLALFFMAVGMGADLPLLLREMPLVIGLTVALLTIKAAVLTLLCLAFGFRRGTAVHVGLGLAQAGEFGFLVFGLADQLGIMDPEIRQLAILVVATSMALTPVLLALGQRAERLLDRRPASLEQIDQAMAGYPDPILIAGFGRVGQTMSRMLGAAGVPYVAVDVDEAMVAKGRAQGARVFFGDACHPEVLKAAGIERARAAIVTLDEAGAADRAVRVMRGANSELPIVARARDPEQCAHLSAAGATRVVPEILEGSMQIGAAVLALIGTTQPEIVETLEELRRELYAEIEGPVRVGASPAEPT